MRLNIERGFYNETHSKFRISVATRRDETIDEKTQAIKVQDELIMGQDKTIN